MNQETKKLHGIRLISLFYNIFDYIQSCIDVFYISIVTVLSSHKISITIAGAGDFNSSILYFSPAGKFPTVFVYSRGSFYLHFLRDGSGKCGEALAKISLNQGLRRHNKCSFFLPPFTLWQTWFPHKSALSASLPAYTATLLIHAP